MATVQEPLSALPITTAIDPVNDYTPIVTASPFGTNRTNRNSYLQLASAPVGLTDAQTLTNKTITAPILGGSVTGTYTLGGTPTFPSSVMTLTGTQTATNKTLTSPTITSPTITGGTIDNSTITVDSISGHTTSTIVSVGGVQMNNGVIGTTGAVTTNSIAAGAVVPNSLVASSGTGWAWQSWTPTLTNLTLGNGTSVGNYVQIGKAVYFRYIFTLGSSGSAVGSGPTITLPVTANAAYASPNYSFEVGVGLATCASTDYLLFCEIGSATTFRPLLSGTASTYLSTRTPFAATTPGSWTSGNYFTLQGYYEAA